MDTSNKHPVTIVTVVEPTSSSLPSKKLSPMVTITPLSSAPLPKSKIMAATNVDPSSKPKSTLMTTYGKWHIRPDILYLDNGAFGACPVEIVEKQKEVRQRIEENPHDFYERAYVSAWETSRTALAGFLHVQPADLVIVPGATHGLNIVIQSQRFQPDDEIITTNHAYSSVMLALDCVTKRDRARLVTVDIPLHNDSQDDVLNRILEKVTPKTRFAVIDHIPSRSGLIFPIKEIVRRLADLGVDTCVDGAHAAGMLELDITDINGAYYVANCHKWMCSPRGVGFLHVRPDKAHLIKPLVVARSPYVVGKNKYSKLEHGFGWFGTHCPSAVMTLPACINHLNTVIPATANGGVGGLKALSERNHEMVVAARRIVCAALGVTLPCPDDMIGAMATIPLPDSPGPEQEGMLPIQQLLWREHKIVVPVYSWPKYPKRVVRLSAQAYNSLGEYVEFARCLLSVLAEERKMFPRATDTEPPRQIAVESSCGGHEKHEANEYEAMGLEITPGGCSHEIDVAENAMDESDEKTVLQPQDIENPDIHTMIQLSKERLRKIATGTFAQDPVALYPTACMDLVQFARETAGGGSEAFRHPNMEITKMTYMLSHLPRRRIPQLMARTVCNLLSTDDVIANWTTVTASLKDSARILLRNIIDQMKAPEGSCSVHRDAISEACFARRVIPYETEASPSNLGLRLWRRALSDFNKSGSWSPEQIAPFLQIHAFLKCPVAGLLLKDKAPMEEQTKIFTTLSTGLTLELATREALTAQLALESSFISQPLASRLSYVHFTGDQQLAYAHVDFSELARCEFAYPSIVVGMVRDILSSPDLEKGWSIAPIAVAQGHTMCSEPHSESARPVTIIIDGNNRCTTLTFMRFVALHGSVPPPDAGDEALRKYCDEHNLGAIQLVDLRAVLALLSTPEHSELAANLSDAASQGRLSRFAAARQVPVLVTEEASFITESRPRTPDGGVGPPDDVLQPVQQSVFAAGGRLAAIPSKMQSHGRAKGFRAMPIR